jgi:phospholipid/cholesterol/gamma-HCH transport system ATP-binding protein
VINVRNLSVRYGTEVILKGVSLKVYRGEILIIAGGSGSGKSTLLRHMIGLARPEHGAITIDGIDLTHAAEEELRTKRKDVGMLFQASGLLGSMTVGENIALPLKEFTNLPGQLVDTIVRVKLDMVGLAGYENHLPGELSGGMRKRAGIARAMALDPNILFLDEPFAGLDPITTAELEVLIRRLNREMGTTMVIVSHELESIFALADRIVMLDKETKGIIAEGNPIQLKKSSSDSRVRDFLNRYVHEDGSPHEKRL